jgi:hypothetical protein
VVHIRDHASSAHCPASRRRRFHAEMDESTTTITTTQHKEKSHLRSLCESQGGVPIELDYCGV